MNGILRFLVISFLFSMFIIPSLSSCEHDPDFPPAITGPDSIICFDTKVLPIIVSNCGISGCHDGSGEFSLLDYGSIAGKVKAGDPNKSELYDAIIPNKWTKNTYMPPAPHTLLNNAQITIIELWIMEGAQNTSCSN